MMTPQSLFSARLHEYFDNCNPDIILIGTPQMQVPKEIKRSGSGDLEGTQRLKAETMLFNSMRKMVHLGKTIDVKFCLFDLFLPACYSLMRRKAFF